jgi:hypothetical protein
VKKLLQLLVTANVPGAPILITLQMEVIPSSKTSFLRATWHNIPEDNILQFLKLIAVPLHWCRLWQTISKLPHFAASTTNLVLYSKVKWPGLYYK